MILLGLVFSFLLVMVLLILRTEKNKETEKRPAESPKTAVIIMDSSMIMAAITAAITEHTNKISPSGHAAAIIAAISEYRNKYEGAKNA